MFGMNDAQMYEILLVESKTGEQQQSILAIVLVACDIRYSYALLE